MKGNYEVSTRAATPVYGFGAWEVDTAKRELRLSGAQVPLGGRAFDIIEVLVQASGKLVTKDQLMAAVWPGMVIEENTLQVHVSAVRKALGADREILKTASGRGYRLAGEWTSPRTTGPAKPIQESPALAQTPTTNLPTNTVELVGRHAALQQLITLLCSHRIVTLTGPGGIGKTVLALHAARRLLPTFGAAWLVEFASLSDGDMIPSTGARAMGLAPQGGEFSAESLARTIGAQKQLLVLDSCEHLIEATARFVDTVVRLCPRVSVLATSREVLRIPGESVYRVPPLDFPPETPLASANALDHSAVQLFVTRAQAADSSFSLTTESATAIASICRRLDGIPLAIEFAATRAAMLGSDLVLSRLDERFGLLAGHRTTLPRHQTLRAALDWSYDLLSEREKQLLCRLSVFASTFNLEAAIAVMSDTGATASAVSEGIANLCAKSLVTLDNSSSSTRWRLLETIRAYAFERLGETEEKDSVARLHARYLQGLLAPATINCLVQFTTEQLLRYRLEIDNVRAALDWAFSPRGDAAVGIALTAAYGPVWLNLSLMAECRERTEQALRCLNSDSDLSAPLLMQLNLQHGVALTFTMGPVERTRCALRKSLEIAESLNDLCGQLRSLWALWAVHQNTGQGRLMQEDAERFSTVAARTHDPDAVLIGDRLIGMALHFSGNPGAARPHFVRVLELYKLTEQPPTIWAQYNPRILSRAMLARTLCVLGLVEQAVAQAQVSLEEAQTGDFRLSQCSVIRLATFPISLITGDTAGAEKAVAMYSDLATLTNSTNNQMLAECAEGALLIRRREFASGLEVLRGGLALAERTGWTTSFPEFLGALGEGLAGLGQLDEALAVLERAIEWGERGGERWYCAELHRMKGELFLQKAAAGCGPEAIECAAAEASFQRGLEVAREQGALLWELRSALSLGRYWKRQNRRTEAKQLLAPVYELFTEGFQMQDLRSAKELLESL